MPPRPPRPRDSDATRAALLSQATAAFAERGFAGARIDEIAERASVNKRMIYAYFGDKDGLYRAVLEAHLSRALAFARPDARPGESARAEAERIVRRYFEFLAANPDFVRLLSWEALSGEHRARAILLERIGAGLAPLHAIVRRGVREGAFRPGAQPRRFLMSVNALFIGYFNHESLLEALWGTDLRSPRARSATLDDLVRLLFEGIGAHP